MGSMAKRVGSGVLSLFVMTGTAMGQQAPVAPGKAASQPAFTQEGFKAQVDKAVADEAKRRAATPVLKLQSEDGAKICGATPEIMLQAREFAVQFSRYEKATDKVFFSKPEGEKRVEYQVTEKGFQDIATSLAMNPPQRGQGDCAMKWWQGKAIEDAITAFTAPK